MYALVDCNCMYASCELVFRPDLRGKPVIVLTNNDGCVAALTAEAKALGIKSFTPYFEIKELCEYHGVTVFSSNYALYGDISSRIMDILQAEAPDSYVYSIDEVFLDYHNCPSIDLRETGQNLRRMIWAQTRMPVCVGIGATKTLSKLANHIAKKHPKANGVCFLEDGHQINRWLSKIPVEGVWGIGMQTTKKLNDMGIQSAYQLAHADKKYIRRQFNVMIERTARELTGEKCFDLHETVEDKKQIIVSRMFGKRITSLNELKESLASYASMATAKLRKQSGLVKTLLINIQSSRFDKNPHSKSLTIQLPHPTCDTRIIIKEISSAVETIFRSDIQYARAMVCLLELSNSKFQQYDMLCKGDSQESLALMALVDSLNVGNKSQLFIGRQGIEKEWSMKRELMSPRYTTSWNHIPKIKMR